MARTGRFLLDTNIVIALFATEAAVQQRLAEASEVFVPSIVLGELYYGSRKSTRSQTISRALMNLSRPIRCCHVTRPPLSSMEISKTRTSKGQPIPENDIWIAAIAMQYQFTLVHVMDIFTSGTLQLATLWMRRCSASWKRC